MQLWTAFALGLLGGLHCAGMCGPLMLALPMGPRRAGTFVVGRVVYQLGRVATYAVLGVLSGLVGRTLWAAGVQQSISILLGLLVLAGLALTPRFLQSDWVTRGVMELKRTMAAFLQRRGFLSLAVLGTLNGLLPCGLVYAACAAAAATGSAWEGARYMLVFGAGTFPVMLGISLSGRLIPTSWRVALRHLVPVSVAVVGCLLILRGMSLGIPYVSPKITGSGMSCCHGP